MLNPNSYAVTQAKNNALCKLILIGTSEPLGTFTWDPYLELWNLPKPYLYLESPSGNLDWELLLGILQPLQPLLWSWNPYLEPRNLRNLEPLQWLGTLLGGTLEPPWILDLQPLLGTSEPSGTFTWNPYLEQLLGTSEPRGTLRDDCPRVPQGLVWLRPQSFQLLGKTSPETRVYRLPIFVLYLNSPDLPSKEGTRQH